MSLRFFLTFWLLLGLSLLLAPHPAQAQCSGAVASTFLFNFGSAGNGNGQFNTPTNLAVDAAGRIYVADSANHRIQVFDANGNFLFTFGSIGNANGQFFFPRGIAVDAAGRIYVADRNRHRIQVFDAAGNFLFTFGSFGNANGQFGLPEGIALDAAGRIYVADTGNDRIQVFDANGNFLFTFGSLGNGNGQFDTPLGISVDAAGRIYVADAANNRIQAFDAQGNFLFTFGSVGIANGQFDGPIGITVDAAGRIYVSDFLNNRLQVFDTAGNFLFTFGSVGNGNGQFLRPWGIAVDAAGRIQVADANNRVQVFAGCPPPPRVSDQKAGSVLVFPYYTSTLGGGSDTRMTISNVSNAASTVANQAYVHLFLIDGATCQQADFFLCLTPNASFSFKASEYDPGNTGYVIAVAVNNQGVPVNNNVLVGNAFVTTPQLADNYGAEAFRANTTAVATVSGNTATLQFDNVGYDAVPNQFAVEIQSPLDAIGQQIITASLSGNLTTSSLTGAAQVSTGQAFNEKEQFASFQNWLSGTCQAKGVLATNSPRVPNGLSSLIKTGQSGYLKFNVGGAVGLLLTPRGGAWTGIRTLHKTQTTAATLTIPIFVPVC